MPNTLACRLSAALTVLTLLAATAAHAQRTERGSLIYDGIPPRDAALAETLGHYLESRSARFLDWLPDGTVLIATRFADTEQVHRVSAPLGAREQLTYFTDHISAARAPQVAHARDFLFLKDSGGNEQAQIYDYRLADRSVRLLSDGKSIHGDLTWSHDGKHYAFYSTARDGVSYDIYVAELGSSAAPRLVHAADHDTWRVLDWSADDQKLLLQRYVSINESYLFIVDAWSGISRPLDESGHQIGIKAARFAPDHRGVIVASDEDNEYTQLRYIDPITHDSHLLVPASPGDIEAFDITADGRYLAYVRNEDGHFHLTVVDNQAKVELTPPEAPDGRITELRFDVQGKRLAFSAESAQSPRDVFVYDLEHSRLERWTRSEAGPVDAAKFVTPERIRYPTWDRADGGRRNLTAWMYRRETGKPAPVIIQIHGGPESQFNPGFEPFIQYLVNELGFAVIAPNVRGSSGYGKSFLKLDNGELREDAVKDIGSLIVWLGLQPGFDRDHIIVMGGSYGGYMTLASLVAYSDRLRGGVDTVGISNFVSFLTNTSAYRRDQRRAEYGDERDLKMRTFLSRISPLNNAASIRRPVLIVQGLNDPRVPASESQQMVAVLRGRGNEAWYLAAKDEGHGFKKKSNRDAYFETVALFLERLKR